ncbi:MAG: hypothetical protein ABSD10_03235 [Candidatus Saccharimonadales bacterium]|jgi:uncharacterized membrane protein YjgN (DUF898 family)
MKYKLKVLVLGLISFVAFLVLPVNTYAAFNPLGSACPKGSKAANGTVCKDNSSQINSGQNPAVHTIHVATNLIALTAGIVAVVIIIISGFMFATAGGSIGGQRAGDNPTKARNARAALIGSLVGLAIVALAWSIVTFITDRVVH